MAECLGKMVNKLYFVGMTNYKKYGAHLCFWFIGYWLINQTSLTVGVFKAGINHYWLCSTYGTLINAFIFYGHANLLIPKYLNQKKWGVYLRWIGVGLLLLTSLETYLDYFFIQFFPLQRPIPLWELFQENFLIHTFFFLFIAYIYRTSLDWFTNEQQKNQLKKERLSAELAFLKAQIHPHFLFNTLNNLFASAQQSKDYTTANGIAKLANIMRYMLEESGTVEVSIEKEIQLIEHYIALQKIRIAPEDPVEITFTKEGEINGQKMAPLLLIPFVENAFKHGISLRQSSYIQIQLKADTAHLYFQVSNSLHRKKLLDKEQSGIGLANVKKRLALLYPKKHQLQIKEDTSNYAIQLQLNLQP